ncbi:MAG: hypothetical protein MUE40_09060 [Anaerolineae bacterium]|nr:hypothetical protein [Anaerolineae bacterium]
MRFPVWVTIIFALAALALVVGVGQALLRPAVPLIARAGFDDPAITPNADGSSDVTTFRYALARSARVSLTLTGADGVVYAFRHEEPRMAGEYSVLFSGIVDGYTRPGEDIAGVVERRLLPDGVYAWALTAAASDETQSATGTLTITAADAALPLISTFTVSPDVFTPNQDGIADRVDVNVFLEKAADLRVFLIGPGGVELPIAARREGRKPGEAGRHIFDYEGGVDLNAEPPPDGTYTVVAVAQDAAGQRIRRTTHLTILEGGKPLAEIVPQSVGVDVIFTALPYDEAYFTDLNTPGARIDPPADPQTRAGEPITMQVGQMLVFKLTVENYSSVPIRTTTPPPGTVYQQQQLAAAVGAFESSGAWRVGIQCETSIVPYPYRWALGTPDVLETVVMPDGERFYYLPPGQRAVVWGAIRMTDIEQRQNPQTCWAGLIHEDVEVSLINSVVGPRDVELVDPAAPARTAP